jgi:transcriptional regulator with XRE-family HTH domain
MYTISLEAARINAGLSQKEAAQRIGVNVATLSNWERGKTSPDVDKFKLLCAVYECPIDMMRMGK